MYKRLHNILIISALLPASILFIADIWGLFVLTLGDLAGSELYLALGIFLGFIGYFGLWRLLIIELKEKVFLSIILLSCGVISCLLVIEPIILLVAYFFDSKKLGLIIFLWPNLVAIFYIILLTKKMILVE